MTAEVTASRAASAPLPEMLAWKARRSVSECEKNVGGEGDLLLAGDYAPLPHRGRDADHAPPAAGERGVAWAAGF